MQTTDISSSSLRFPNATRRQPAFRKALAACAALLSAIAQLSAAPLTPVFTYQGRLSDGASPANGSYDFRFALLDAATAGNPVASPLTNSAVAVNNGLFTVALDFGPAAFNGEARWLEVAVRTNGFAGAFVPLNPLQPVGATPYSQYTLKAAAADQAGAVAADQVLLFSTQGQRALRLEPGTNGMPNVIGGSGANYVPQGVTGAAIGGGDANTNKANLSVIGGGSGNLIDTNSLNAGIGGGYANWIGANSFESVIAGGNINTVSDYVYDGFIGGGYANYLGWGAVYSVINGGFTNTVEDSAEYSVIGGGTNNTIRSSSLFSVIAGGEQSLIGTNGLNNTVSGGGRNEIRSVYGGTIGGGYYNTVGDLADYSTVSGGYDNLVVDSASYATIPGGQNAAAVSYGQLAYASGSTQWYGDAQSSLFVLRNSTTNATQAELFLDGTSQRMFVPEGGTWTYHILLVARSASGNSSCYEAKGGIKNVNGTLSLVSTTPTTMTSLGSEISGLAAPRVQADTANAALTIRATGVAGQVIRWVARVQTTEVIF